MYTALALASKPSLLNLQFSHCCKLGSLGANSKTELVCMNVIKECLGISTCGREGKERKGKDAEVDRERSQAAIQLQ